MHSRVLLMGHCPGLPPLHKSAQTDKKYALKKKSKEEKEAELVGRLKSPVLRELLEEHAWCACLARLESLCLEHGLFFRGRCWTRCCVQRRGSCWRNMPGAPAVPSWMFLIRFAAAATLAAAGACLMHLPLTGRAAIAAGCGKGVTA